MRGYIYTRGQEHGNQETTVLMKFERQEYKQLQPPINTIKALLFLIFCATTKPVTVIYYAGTAVRWYYECRDIKSSQLREEAMSDSP